MANIALFNIDDENENPALVAITHYVARTYRLAIEKVVAHHAEPDRYPLPPGRDAIEHVLADRFRRLARPLQDAAVHRVMADVRAPAAVRDRWLRGSAIADLRLAEPVEGQTLPARAQLVRSLATLTALDAWRMVLPATDRVPRAGNAVGAGPRIQSVRLRIASVTCHDETDGFILNRDAGQDEISLGGVTTDPAGNVHRVAPFHVGNFDSGDHQHYDPPHRIFHTFAIAPADNLWPKTFFCTLVLAEVDMGGLHAFVEALVDGITAKVASVLAEVAAGAAGGAFGGAVAGGLLGAAIGAAVGAAVAVVFALLKSAWSDDIFKPRTVQITLLDPADRFGNDELTSTVQTVHFRGHGGHYHVSYRWLLTV